MYDVLAIQPWVLCPDMEEETGIVPSLISSSPLLEGTHMYALQQVNLYSASIHSTYLLLYGDGQRRSALCSKVAYSLCTMLYTFFSYSEAFFSYSVNCFWIVKIIGNPTSSRTRKRRDGGHRIVSKAQSSAPWICPLGAQGAQAICSNSPTQVFPTL